MPNSSVPNQLHFDLSCMIVVFEFLLQSFTADMVNTFMKNCSITQLALDLSKTEA